MVTSHSSLILSIAGIAFFMLGLNFASESLQKLAGNKLKPLLYKFSEKPIWGVGAGICLTVLIQSSGAVTSMLVGLGSAGVIKLRQVMGILLGTAIGTTLTVQLLSLDVKSFGLPIFSISFLIYFLTQKPVVKNLMGVFIGFGLIFWGMELIGYGTSDLKEAELFVGFLETLKQYPLLAIGTTAVFTALVHSSAVTIGLSMAFAAGNLLSVSDAIYWVYGANIGTTATALFASAAANYVGRQVAWAHCFYKLLSVGLFLPFTFLFAQLIDGVDVERSIANAHLLFNVISAVVFFFLLKYGAQLIEYIIKPTEDEFTTKYLTHSSLESEEVAVAHAERELMRMTDIVHSMIEDSFKLFQNYTDDLADSIRQRDDKVDLLTREINLFIARFAEYHSERLPRRMMNTMSFATDLESAADVIDSAIMDMAKKKRDLNLDFSSEGLSELMDFHQRVCELSSISVSCFQTKSSELGSKVIYLKREVRKIEKQMRESHFERMVQGVAETIRTSSIHLDLLSEYRRIVGLLSNYAYSQLKESDRYNLLPRRG